MIEIPIQVNFDRNSYVVVLRKEALIIMHFWTQKCQKWMEITKTNTCAAIINIIYSLTKNKDDSWQAN